MVIAALSQYTVRLLGSSTVITTPIDLVKELLDNAIDAKATSVEILVAPNLVDKIEVRDNGHGISKEDYDSLGRTGHTSKITSFDEIPSLGGSTLGFRGKALASANSLGKVTVTTRTAMDPTAILLTLRTGVGGTDNKQRVPAPVGTTVAVTGLYSNFPVRVRTAIKDAPKNMSKIRQLLQKYALARPGIRLSFKSLGGKTKWSYSPRPQATVREAVIQVFGTEVVSQCMIRTIVSGQDDEEIEFAQHSGHMFIQAVLPSADGDLSKISNKGAFFAVDSRPLTSSSGTMRKLLKTFKSLLARALSEADGHDCPRDPFICVNVRCSPGSYDVNIEPSKSQVIFASESLLTELFERLCTEVYKTPQKRGAFVTLETRRLLQGPQTQTHPLSSGGPHEDVGSNTQTPCSEYNHGPNSLESTVDIVGVVDNRHAFQPVRPYEFCLGNPTQPPITTCGLRSSEICHLKKASRTGADPVRRHAQRTPVQEDLRESATVEVENIDGALSNLESRAEDAPGMDSLDDLDMSSDEEAEVLASYFRGQLGARIRDRNRERAIEPSNLRTMGENIAPTQQPLGGTAVPEGDAFNSIPSYSLHVDQTAEESFDDLPILQPHRGLAGNLQPTRAMHMGNTHPTHKPYLPSIASHSSLESNLGTVSALNATQEAQSQSRFNGRHPLPTLRPNHEQTRGNIGPDGLVQTTISFGGTKPSQNPKAQPAQLHVDDMPSRSNPPYCKPWKDNHGKGGSKAPRKSRNVQSHAIHRVDHRQIDRLGHDETGFSSNECANHPEVHILPRPDDHALESSITSLPRPTECSEAEHQRRGRPVLQEMKSDMLPLETVPNTYQMHRLVLNMTPDVEMFGNPRKNMFRDTDFDGGFCADTKLGQDMGLEDAAEVETRLRRLLDEWTLTTLGQRICVDVNIGALVKGKTAAT